MSLYNGTFGAEAVTLGVPGLRNAINSIFISLVRLWSLGDIFGMPLFALYLWHHHRNQLIDLSSESSSIYATEVCPRSAYELIFVSQEVHPSMVRFPRIATRLRPNREILVLQS
jgi:hypothetical protein